MRRSPLMIAVLAGALLLAGCTSSSSSAPSRRATVPVATPSEQAAALRATSTFRSLMAASGQRIAADVNALDHDAHGGDTAGALGEANAALLEYDRVRSYAESNGGAASTSGAPISDRRLLEVAAGLRSGRDVTTLTGTMVESAPLLEVLLSRVILAPATVTLRAQDSIAWVSQAASAAYSPSPPPGATPEDCRATVKMAAAAYEGLVLLGQQVASASTAKTGAQLAALEAVMAGSPDPRRVVQAADASVADLGQLAGQLAGFGEGGEYQ